jgi:hypothetical protein
MLSDTQHPLRMHLTVQPRVKENPHAILSKPPVNSLQSVGKLPHAAQGRPSLSFLACILPSSFSLSVQCRGVEAARRVVNRSQPLFPDLPRLFGPITIVDVLPAEAVYRGPFELLA